MGLSLARAEAGSAKRRGSRSSDSQIYFAVKEQRRVIARFPDGGEVAGYVLGLDDYHVVLMDTDRVIHLVHKTIPCLSVTNLTLSQEHEEVAEELQVALSPFRAFVMRDVYNLSA